MRQKNTASSIRLFSKNHATEDEIRRGLTRGYWLSICAIVLVLLIITAAFVSLWYLLPGVYLRSCTDLPKLGDAERVWADHVPTRQQLEQMQPAQSVKLELDINRCPGRAEVLIYHGTEKQRKKIRKTIGETFHSLPYRTINW